MATSLDMTAIGSHKVISIPKGEKVEIKSLWKEQSVVIIFFRRWGCMFCRLWAKELGEIFPLLKEKNIRLIGIGVEDVGVKDFIDRNYFDGDLYYVENAAIYQALGFKRFNRVSIITSLFWKQSRDAIAKAKYLGLHSNLLGDGFQNGGALIVKKGGKVLHHYIALTPTERMDNMEIAKFLNLGLGGDLKGDWVQTGGLLLVEKGGKLIRHFVQTGPSDHLPNKEICKAFNFVNQYNALVLANEERERLEDAAEAAA